MKRSCIASASLLVLITAALGGVLRGRPVVNALNCRVLPPHEKLAWSDVVFHGRVRAVTVVPRVFDLGLPGGILLPGFLHRVEFAVIKWWKGPRAPQITGWDLEHGVNCSGRYEVGREYLVYAYAGSGPLYRSYIPVGGLYLAGLCTCSWTRRIDRAGGDLAELGPGQPVGQVCPQVASGIPADVQQQAVENPERYSGWGQTRDPNQPPSEWNGWRVWLSLLNPNRPYGPYNPPVWRAGCP